MIHEHIIVAIQIIQVLLRVPAEPRMELFVIFKPGVAQGGARLFWGLQSVQEPCIARVKRVTVVNFISRSTIIIIILTTSTKICVCWLIISLLLFAIIATSILHWYYSLQFLL